jgi:outer membrane biosynthesis protein TonB
VALIFRSTTGPLSREDPTRSSAPLRLTLPGTRRKYDGLAFSVLVHLLLIALLVDRGDRIWSRALAPGDPALSQGGGGGGGGNRVAYITLPSAPVMSAPRETPVRAPVAKPKVEPPQVAVAPAPEAREAPPSPSAPPPVDTVPPAAQPGPPGTAAGAAPGAGPGTGGGTGGGAGTGAGPGTGAGAGPGAGGGGGGRVQPPVLRDFPVPFDDPPKELRGATLVVTFWVRADGRVDRYEVAPVIDNGDFARKFGEVMRAFKFTPARAQDGSRIAGTTTVEFTLSGKRKS